MSSEEPVIDGRPISELKVVDLKKELELRGLDKKGNKKDLYERLRDFLVKQTANKSPEKTDESKSAINPLVAQYLATQEQALKAARRDAEMMLTKRDENEQQSLENIETEKTVSAQDSNKVKEEKTVALSDDNEGGINSENLSQRIDDDVDGNIKVIKTQQEDQDLSNKDLNIQSNNKQEVVEAHVEESLSHRNKDEMEHQPIEKIEGGMSKIAADSDSRSGSTSPNESHTSENEVSDMHEEKSGESEKELTRKWTPELITSTTKADEENVDDGHLGKHVADSLNEDADVVQNRSSKVEKADDELDYDEVKETSSPEAQQVENVIQVVSTAVAKAENETTKEPAKRMLINAAKESKESTSDSKEIITEDGFKRDHPPSPARYLVSRFIHIRCLKRPFTPKALRNMLSTYGTVLGEMWLDDIKSQCIAQFETEEQAQIARERIHNVQWPTFNDSFLRVDYTTEDNLTKRLNVQEDVSVDEDALKLTVTVENKELGHDNGFKKERETGTSEYTKHEKVSRRHSDRNEDEKKVEQPTKTLEALFHKTKAQPSIYYLPLTDEQAEKRMEIKKTEERERKKAIESRGSPERKRARRDSPPPNRRRY